MTKREPPLWSALDRLMHEARLNPTSLSRLSKVSRQAIYGYRNGRVPSSAVLLDLATALATGPAGVVDQAVRATAFHTLSKAAGYPTNPDGDLPPSGVLDDLPVGVDPVAESKAHELGQRIYDAFGGDQNQIADFFLQTEPFDDLDRDLILDTVVWLKGRISAGREYEKRRAAEMQARSVLATGGQQTPQTRSRR